MAPELTQMLDNTEGQEAPLYLERPSYWEVGTLGVEEGLVRKDLLVPTSPAPSHTIRQISFPDPQNTGR